MGYGHYSDEAVKARVDARVDSGRPAVSSYTHDVSTGRVSRKVHKDLDPKGAGMRESRDSTDHPNSNAVILVLDETGSMGRVVTGIQASLKPLMGLLTKKGYLEDPQIMVMAIGDEFEREVAPLQASQFESDDRIEQNLDNILIERGGGGSMQESYQNAAYFIAKHTATDAWEKRGKKGYVFIFGDEKNYDQVSKDTIEKLIGDTIEKNLFTEEIYKEVLLKWQIFFVLPRKANHGGSPVIKKHWGDLIGSQNVLELDDENAAAECVGVQIGLCEGTTDLDSFAADIKDIRTDLDPAGTTALVKAVSGSVSKAYAGGAITRVKGDELAPSESPPNVGRI